MRRLPHLIRRFFTSWRARRPGPHDQRFVGSVLRAAEHDLFWRQPVLDLDHAVRGARHLRARAPGRTDLVRAFLLHDVGKRHARLGVVGRSIATGLDMLGIRLSPRHKAYLDHGEVGAAELAALGCDALTVAFARHHHGPVPAGVDASDWSLLVSADRR